MKAKADFPLAINGSSLRLPTTRGAQASAVYRRRTKDGYSVRFIEDIDALLKKNGGPMWTAVLKKRRQGRFSSKFSPAVAPPTPAPKPLLPSTTPSPAPARSHPQAGQPQAEAA